MDVTKIANCKKRVIRSANIGYLIGFAVLLFGVLSCIKIGIHLKSFLFIICSLYIIYLGFWAKHGYIFSNLILLIIWILLTINKYVYGSDSSTIIIYFFVIINFLISTISLVKLHNNVNNYKIFFSKFETPRNTLAFIFSNVNRKSFMYYLLTFFFFLLMVSFFILLLYGWRNYPNAHLFSNYRLYVFSGGLISLLSYIFILSLRQKMITASKISAIDNRRPILFLRSFKDDGIKLTPTNTFPAIWNDIIYSNQILRNLIGTVDLERVVVDEFNKIGPIIAIGEPGEKLPPYGAARDYLPNDNWRSIVSSLLDLSRAIVVILGKTDSLKWEIDQIVRKKYINKTLFIVPFGKINEIQQRIDILFSSIEKENIELPFTIENDELSLVMHINKQGEIQFYYAYGKDQHHAEVCLAYAINENILKEQEDLSKIEIQHHNLLIKITGGYKYTDDIYEIINKSYQKAKCINSDTITLEILFLCIIENEKIIQIFSNLKVNRLYLTSFIENIVQTEFENKNSEIQLASNVVQAIENAWYYAQNDDNEKYLSLKSLFIALFNNKENPIIQYFFSNDITIDKIKAEFKELNKINNSCVNATLKADIRYLHQTYNAWKEGELSDISMLYENEVSRLNLEEFIDDYSTLFGETFSSVSIKYPSEKGEYVVQYVKNNYLLTNHRLIFLNYHSQLGVLYLSNISNYYAKDEKSIIIETKLGESYLFTDIDIHPDKKIVDYFIDPARFIKTKYKYFDKLNIYDFAFKGMYIGFKISMVAFLPLLIILLTGNISFFRFITALFSYIFGGTLSGFCWGIFSPLQQINKYLKIPIAILTGIVVAIPFLPLLIFSVEGVWEFEIELASGIGGFFGLFLGIMSTFKKLTERIKKAVRYNR